MTDEIKKKKWFLSKTVLIAVVIAILAILKERGIELPPYITELLTALGLIVARTSSTKLKL